MQVVTACYTCKTLTESVCDSEIGRGVIRDAFSPIPNNLLVCELKSVRISTYDIIFKFDHRKGFWCHLVEEKKSQKSVKTANIY